MQDVIVSKEGPIQDFKPHSCPRKRKDPDLGEQIRGTLKTRNLDGDGDPSPQIIRVRYEKSRQLVLRKEKPKEKKRA